MRRNTVRTDIALWWMSALVVFDAVEDLQFLFDCHPRPERSREFVRTPCPDRNEGASHVCDHSPLRRCGPESLRPS